MKNVEQELKLRLTEREYRLLAERSDVKPQLQTNYYFYYDGMPRDEMVRLRQKGDAFLLCYKRRLSCREAVCVSDERECEITSERARYILQRGISVDEMRKLFGVTTVVPLLLAGKLETYRTKFVLSGWVLELDKNVYLDVTDYELECENDDVSELDKLKSYLFREFGIVAQPSNPKSERFYQALNK